MENFLPRKETTQKALKYVESLGKTTLIALLMQYGISEYAQAQNKNLDTNKIDTKELINKTNEANKKIYAEIKDRFKNISLGDYIQYTNSTTGEIIKFLPYGDGYLRTSLEVKEGSKDVIYVDIDGNGTMDRMLESEENFKQNPLTSRETNETDAKAAKLARFEIKAFESEDMLKEEAEFVSFGDGFIKEQNSEKIMVYEFKDMDKNPTFTVYNFKEGTYSKTNNKDFQNKISELQLELQKKYAKAAEKFSKEVEK
ncbi:MAG: hypothetical protein WCS86_03375 [Candidatus Paceibacterota bacterium]